MNWKSTVKVAALAVALGLAGAPAVADTTYEYDALGRLVKVIYDDGTTIEYKYDAAGNRTEVIKKPPPA